MRKSSTPQSHTSDITSNPVSPSNITPITDNVLMDVDSDAEADQAAPHRPRSRFALPTRLGRGVRRSGREERRKRKCNG